MAQMQALADSKCIVARMRDGEAKTQKFKIFIQDKMYKFMAAEIKVGTSEA